MNANKKELEVAALENGTVIDHIPSDQLFKVVSLLGLEKLNKSITIGNNLISKKIGKKGIIKIADTFFKEEEINKIALIAPNAKINIIKTHIFLSLVAIVAPPFPYGKKTGNPPRRNYRYHQVQ